MRKLALFSLAEITVIFLLTLCSCNQNDGHIGNLFGIWSLTAFYNDDTEFSEDMDYGYSLRFQADVVQYVQNQPYHDSQMFIGHWRQSSDSLILEFPDVVMQHKAPSSDIPKGMTQQVYFPIEPVLRFKINTLSNSVLDISRTINTGEELRYYFRKLN